MHLKSFSRTKTAAALQKVNHSMYCKNGYKKYWENVMQR